MSITVAECDMGENQSLIQQLKQKQERLNIQLKQVAEALEVLENPASALTVLENANAERLVTIVLDARYC